MSDKVCWAAVVKQLRLSAENASDPEGARVAAQCISEAFEVNEGEAPKTGLFELVNEGLRQLEPDLSSAQLDTLFDSYITFATESGIFSGLQPGSTEYNKKYDLAVQRFKEKRQPPSWWKAPPVDKYIKTSSETAANNGATNDVVIAEEFKAKGNTALSSGNIDQAIKEYTSAIHAAPTAETSHVYYANRAAAYTKQKKYSEAAEDAQQAINLKPDWPRGYSRRGTALYLKNDFKGAEEAYAKLLEIDPSNEDAREWLSKARERLQSSESAPTSHAPGGSPSGGFDMSALSNLMSSLGGSSNQSSNTASSQSGNQQPGGFDLSSLGNLMNNPEIMNAAQNLMSNPQFRDSMPDLMSRMFNSGNNSGNNGANGTQ